jgi:hypothetical protein
MHIMDTPASWAIEQTREGQEEDELPDGRQSKTVDGGAG